MTFVRRQLGRFPLWLPIELLLVLLAFAVLDIHWGTLYWSNAHSAAACLFGGGQHPGFEVCITR